MNRSLFSIRHTFFIAALLLLISGSTPAYAVTPVSTSKTTTTKTVVVKPVVTTPASTFEVSGWIPYWRTATGTADVMPHLNVLTEVNPFGYTVKNNGELYNALGIEKPEWQALKTASNAKKVRFIPTVMWSDTEAIHNVLSNPTLRAAHIKAITDAVTQNGFDGIDIDYEGKSADDKDNFTLFLKELSAKFAKNKMNKWLMCTIEARQPLSARYSGAIPDGIAYANSLPDINKYCDRVRIMTYDQQNADVQLNKAHESEIYTPIADTAWVEKVVNYMGQDISKKKMVIGVATYGYIYQAIPNLNSPGYTYDKIEAFNPKYATDLAQKYGITPTRNAAGEMSFTYAPLETTPELPSNAILSAMAPAGTSSANLAAAGAVVLAQTQKKQAPVQVLWWSDATAVAQKVSLAKKLSIRGVAVFKFDGGEDQNIWNVLK